MTAAATPAGSNVEPDAPADGPTGPPGWHPDPFGRHVLRYFDGRLWTEHVASGGVAGLDSTPVADLPRSRPAPVQPAPPDDPVGARVLPPVAEGGPDVRVAPLLLVAPATGAATSVLRLPDDSEAGSVVLPPPGPLARLGRALVAAPSTVATRVRVLDAAGTELLHLARPARRTAAVVDVAGPDGPLGQVVADAVLQGLRARVVAADGTVVGVVAEAGGRAGALDVTADDGTTLTRLTEIWDIPGSRRHLPPGVLLLDRRGRGDGDLEPRLGALLLAAVLAPALLRPPPPPEP